MLGDTESYNLYRRRSIAWLNLSKLVIIITKLPPLSMLTLHVGGKKSKSWRHLCHPMGCHRCSTGQTMYAEVTSHAWPRTSMNYLYPCHGMPPLNIVNNYRVIECESVPAKYIISVENVENQLSRLNTKKATGPDNMPTRVLRDFCQVLAGPIACL